jgi:phosphotransferase system  glucose/maltose/N-acetylglucosamine-specific IIC component
MLLLAVGLAVAIGYAFIVVVLISAFDHEDEHRD